MEPRAAAAAYTHHFTKMTLTLRIMTREHVCVRACVSVSVSVSVSVCACVCVCVCVCAGRATIPDDIKADLLERIRKFLASN